jgi:phage gpG-like protein
MLANQIYENLKRVIAELAAKGKQLSPVMRIISALAEESILRNFAENGRYDGNDSNITIFSGGSTKWKALAPGTVTAYQKKGWSPLVPTLNRSKGLKSRLEVMPTSRGMAISSLAPYAAIHQFGGVIQHPGGTPYGFMSKGKAQAGKIVFLKKNSGFMVIGKTKPHQIVIPARPYLVFQDADFQEWTEIVADFYTQ